MTFTGPEYICTSVCVQSKSETLSRESSDKVPGHFLGENIGFSKKSGDTKLWSGFGTWSASKPGDF